MARVAEISLVKTVFRIYGNKQLRRAANNLLAVIARHFFFPQHRAALLPGRIPVTDVDHRLDRHIPFAPGHVNTYLDFIPSWIRMTGFLFSRYGRGAIPDTLHFITAMTRLYRFAAEVYRAHFSTTNRPRYYGKTRFVIIHLTDPHLMCIPSLHVMIVLYTWTAFRAIAARRGDGARLAEAVDEVFTRACAITEAVLYVKQHSLNCVSAALYAITRFPGGLFSEEDAARFAARLFTGPAAPKERAEIRDYILFRYRAFLAAARPGADWKEPLLAFLREPQAQE
ncbi:MAG: hypothetical protein LBC88_01455 [Spirochaetaceae bacterium]|jgi:hypothetical protein|nr:hypothetical protein [Spirochaetaceae bacterium]